MRLARQPSPISSPASTTSPASTKPGATPNQITSIRQATSSSRPASAPPSGSSAATERGVRRTLTLNPSPDSRRGEHILYALPGLGEGGVLAPGEGHTALNA